MYEHTTLATRAIAAVAVACAIFAAILVTNVSAQEESVSVSSSSAAVGGEASVTVTALGITDPGLGAWTLDIMYDTALLTALFCGPEQGGVCNPLFDSNIVRITGASASGIEGDNSLGSITFRCDAAGTSALDLTIVLIVDATIGAPQVIDAGASDGSIECGASTPVPPTATPVSSNDVFDCTDFMNQETAQVILEADPTDPHVLDPDLDGVACEGLPPRGTPPVDGFPTVGSGGEGDPSAGRMVRWLTAALAGVSLAGLASIAVLWTRATRPVGERIFRE